MDLPTVFPKWIQRAFIHRTSTIEFESFSDLAREIASAIRRKQDPQDFPDGLKWMSQTANLRLGWEIPPISGSIRFAGLQSPNRQNRVFLLH